MRCVQRRACPRPLHLNLSQRPDSANQLPFMKGTTKDISTKERTNLKFYVAMHAVASTEPRGFASPSAIAAFDVDLLDDQRIQESLDIVKEVYVRLGGDDRVAKGPELLNCLLQSAVPSVV